MNVTSGMLAATASSRIAQDAEVRVRQLKQRDPSAWGYVFENHYPVLYRYAYARLRSREDAEDVAAQVFLNALQGIDRYEHRNRPLLAWLYTIARNLVIKRLQRPVAMNGETLERSHALNEDGDIDEVIDLVRGVDELKEEQREVITLRFSVGLSTRQTATLLGKTEAAVHSLQVRALQNLRRRMRN